MNRERRDVLVVAVGTETNGRGKLALQVDGLRPDVAVELALILQRTLSKGAATEWNSASRTFAASQIATGEVEHALEFAQGVVGDLLDDHGYSVVWGEPAAGAEFGFIARAVAKASN